MNSPATAFPDRVRLPFAFDPRRLNADLACLDGEGWTPHFVERNYAGEWGAIPLRAARGAEHPILMITAHPGAECVDAPPLRRTPYFRELLATFDCPLNAVRLMRLGAGSSILEHCDPGLCAEEGRVRLHIPIRTNPDVRFHVNGRAVAMRPGEVWYLRLSDPHRVDNRGESERVHLVIDADVNDWLERQLSRSEV